MSDIKTILSGLFQVIVEEVETSPGFRRKVEKVLGGLREDVISVNDDTMDYISLYSEQGETALEKALNKLKVKEIDQVLKQYGIKGVSGKNKTQKIILIVEYCRNIPVDAKTDEEESTSSSDPELHNTLPDPLQIFHRDGKDGLLSALKSLGAEDLKSIISSNHLDTKKISRNWNNKEKLIQLIISKVESRLTQGDVFLNYEK